MYISQSKQIVKAYFLFTAMKNTFESKDSSLSSLNIKNEEFNTSKALGTVKNEDLIALKKIYNDQHVNYESRYENLRQQWNIIYNKKKDALNNCGVIKKTRG